MGRTTCRWGRAGTGAGHGVQDNILFSISSARLTSCAIVKDEVESAGRAQAIIHSVNFNWWPRGFWFAISCEGVSECHKQTHN